MNRDFKLPTWFPVPQAVFDACRGLIDQYIKLTFISEISDELPVSAWVHDKRILSDEEANQIKYIETGDISGGYYEVDGHWIQWSGEHYRKVACAGGVVEWKVTHGTGAGGLIFKILEEDGSVTSYETVGSYIA